MVVGHLWIRLTRRYGQARVFFCTGALGVLSTGTVILVRAIDPYVIRYASELSQNMGPATLPMASRWAARQRSRSWSRASATSRAPSTRLATSR